MLSGLFDTHPQVQVILGHMGEGLPFMISRFSIGSMRSAKGKKGRSAGTG